MLPSGPSPHFPRDMEDADARIRERRQMLEGGTHSPSARTRMIILIVFGTVLLAAVAYAVVYWLGLFTSAGTP